MSINNCYDLVVYAGGTAEQSIQAERMRQEAIALAHRPCFPLQEIAIQARYLYPNSRWVAPTAFSFEKPRTDEIKSLACRLFRAILPYERVEAIRSCLVLEKYEPEKIAVSSDSDDSDAESAGSRSDSDEECVEARLAVARPLQYGSDSDDDTQEVFIELLDMTCQKITVSNSEHKADFCAVAIVDFAIQEALQMGLCRGNSYTQLLLQSPEVDPQHKTGEHQRGHILFFQVIGKLIQLVEWAVKSMKERKRIHLAHAEEAAAGAEALPRLLEDIEKQYSSCNELEKYGTHWAEIQQKALDAIGAKERSIYTQQRKPNQSREDFAQVVTVALRSLFSSSHDEYIFSLSDEGSSHAIYVQLSSCKIVDIMNEGSFVFPSVEELIETLGRDSLMRPWDKLEVFIF